MLPEKALADRGAAGGAKAGTDPRVTKHPMNKVVQKRGGAKKAVAKKKAAAKKRAAKKKPAARKRR